jgi:hypothetical protein
MVTVQVSEVRRTFLTIFICFTSGQVRRTCIAHASKQEGEGDGDNGKCAAHTEVDQQVDQQFPLKYKGNTTHQATKSVDEKDDFDELF